MSFSREKIAFAGVETNEILRNAEAISTQGVVATANRAIYYPTKNNVSHENCPNSFTIGRFYRNDVIIEDYTVSSIHAKIFCEEGKYYLSDENSTNGTFINGKQLIEKTPLSPHLKLRISFGRIEFVLMSAENVYHALSESLK